MSSFTDPLDVRVINYEKLPTNMQNRYKKKSISYFLTLEKFSYDVGREGSDNTITVPKGFYTDFASIPRLCQMLISPVGRHVKAAVIHDYLYQNKKPTRKEADKIFLEAMKVLGVAWWRRWIMYRAVRHFGGSSY